MHLITRRMNGQGYLLNDNTAAGEGKQEDDVLSCSHCQALIMASKWKEDGGHCGRCSKPVCGPCADRMLTHGCEPFMKKLHQAIEESYRKTQNARVLGL